MGVLAIGLATGAPAGVAGSVYHLVNHALFKSLLFLCAGAIVHRTGVTSLAEMGGLLRRWPAVAAAFTVGAASIAGIPPLGGYVSLSLIHRGLLDGHQYVPYTLMLLAQLITITALGRAAWLAFFRPRTHEYERSEQLRPGMLTGLVGLSGCCVAFGVVPGFVLDRIMAPAASGLLHATAYSHAVLAGSGSLPAMPIKFQYSDILELTVGGLSLLIAVLLTRVYLRLRNEPVPVRLLRAAHTGSVNDYAAYAVAGMVALIAATHVRGVGERLVLIVGRAARLLRGVVDGLVPLFGFVGLLTGLRFVARTRTASLRRARRHLDTGLRFSPAPRRSLAGYSFSVITRLRALAPDLRAPAGHRAPLERGEPVAAAHRPPTVVCPTSAL
jgi:NADH:ubiquinone oxidoreductase subunit 5 (subunit L)/multisubunit Na+/H+ antiporter MnhA subunit